MASFVERTLLTSELTVATDVAKLVAIIQVTAVVTREDHQRLFTKF